MLVRACSTFESVATGFGAEADRERVGTVWADCERQELLAKKIRSGASIAASVWSVVVLHRSIVTIVQYPLPQVARIIRCCSQGAGPQWAVFKERYEAFRDSKKVTRYRCLPISKFWRSLSSKAANQIASLA